MSDQKYHNYKNCEKKVEKDVFGFFINEMTITMFCVFMENLYHL